ncbi:chromobox protein homolog 2-like [Anguilla rostrata]|uniref:chromobox protein homolog 2-like n=1 Tax=Anguilla rostrata TaxID=7938 RepID=UPI0030CB851E
MSVVEGEVFHAECILNKRPKQGKFEYLVKRRGLPSKEQEKEIILCKYGKRPRGRPRKIVELVSATTESSSALLSPDDDISPKMVKPDCHTCESHPVQQKTAQTVVAREEAMKRKHGRKALPPEQRAPKLLKPPSKALPRQPKPAIKKPLLPDCFTGISLSPRDLVGVPSGQSSGSSGQGRGASQPSAGSLNERQTTKKSKELPVELRDKIVERHISGEGYKKISKSLSISSSTVRSIILKWKVHRTTETLPRSGCPSKLSNQAKSRLVREATARPTVTLKELKSSIAEMGENVSESTISRSLHKAGLYCKVAKRKVQTKGRCPMQSQQGVSPSQYRPYSDVLWWEHYVKEILLSNKNKEASHE